MVSIIRSSAASSASSDAERLETLEKALWSQGLQAMGLLWLALLAPLTAGLVALPWIRLSIVADPMVHTSPEYLAFQQGLTLLRTWLAILLPIGLTMLVPYPPWRRAWAWILGRVWLARSFVREWDWVRLAHQLGQAPGDANATPKLDPALLAIPQLPLTRRQLAALERLDAGQDISNAETRALARLPALAYLQVKAAPSVPTIAQWQMLALALERNLRWRLAALRDGLFWLGMFSLLVSISMCFLSIIALLRAMLPTDAMS